MQLSEVIAGIEKSAEFADWKKSSPAAYLTSAFSVPEDRKEWLVSYFEPESRKMTTFSSEGMQRNEDPFAKEDSIPELDAGKVKIWEGEAIEAARKELDKEYGLSVQKTIVVLQTSDGRPIWNITFTTREMKVVNVRLSAETGSVLKHSAMPINDFMQN